MRSYWTPKSWKLRKKKKVDAGRDGTSIEVFALQPKEPNNIFKLWQSRSPTAAQRLCRGLEPESTIFNNVRKSAPVLQLLQFVRNHLDRSTRTKEINLLVPWRHMAFPLYGNLHICFMSKENLWNRANMQPQKSISLQSEKKNKPGAGKPGLS